jgi:hypothetical protein
VLDAIRLPTETLIHPSINQCGTIPLHRGPAGRARPGRWRLRPPRLRACVPAPTLNSSSGDSGHSHPAAGPGAGLMRLSAPGRRSTTRTLLVGAAQRWPPCRLLLHSPVRLRATSGGVHCRHRRNCRGQRLEPQRPALLSTVGGAALGHNAPSALLLLATASIAAAPVFSPDPTRGSCGAGETDGKSRPDNSDRISGSGGHWRCCNVFLMLVMLSLVFLLQLLRLPMMLGSEGGHPHQRLLRCRGNRLKKQARR